MDGPFLLAAAVVSALTALGVPYVTQRLRRRRGVPTSADVEYIDTLEGLNSALKAQAENLRTTNSELRIAEQACLAQLAEANSRIDEQEVQIGRLVQRIIILENGS